MSRLKLIQKKGYNIICLSGNIDEELFGEITDNIDALSISEGLKMVGFNFKLLTGIEHQYLRDFSILLKDIKANGGNIYTYNIRPKLLKLLRDEGILSLFNYVVKPGEELKMHGIKEDLVKLDVNFLNPFIKATVETFGVQANIDINVGNIIKKELSNLPELSVAGIIGITSEKFNGSMSICFTKDVFLFIYNSMLFTEETEIKPEMEDAAGEFTNIILGMAKSELNAIEGYTIEKAIPSIICGEQITINHKGAEGSLLIPFETSKGTFYIEICIENN